MEKDSFHFKSAKETAVNSIVRSNKSYLKQDESENKECRIGASPMKRALLLRDFDNPASYRRKIRERLRDEEVYVAQQYEGKILYGKLSIENFSVYAWKVSALEAKEVPDGVSIIELQDLKNAMKDYAIRTFLEIRDEESGKGGIIIIDVKLSPLSSQFTKLCTGECGVSYKNCHLDDPIDLKDSNFIEHICLVKKPFEERPKGLSDYILPPLNISLCKKQIIVCGLYDGGAQICRVNGTCNGRLVVGVLVKNPNIERILNGKLNGSWNIEDCGIYFCSEIWD